MCIYHYYVNVWSVRAVLCSSFESYKVMYRGLEPKFQCSMSLSCLVVHY